LGGQQTKGKDKQTTQAHQKVVDTVRSKFCT
jgi:hypothetical protein